jgi:putative membrane-bound dehydrogenase-like protein
MSGRFWKWLCAALLALGAAHATVAAPPRVINDSYKLELVATDPDIVTPIGMAFDDRGRLLVIESHTHQRPKDYQGPPGDRIRMFADSDGDGRLDLWSTFAEGFHNAMNLLVKPSSGNSSFEVYVVSRSEVQLLRDTDRAEAGQSGKGTQPGYSQQGRGVPGDGVAVDVRSVLRLETQDDYPHDGLESIALTGGTNGSLLVGMGENHGKAFRLIGSDGTEVKGEGEGGTIFRCTPEGAQLERWAIGFWNPFSICVGDHIFAVDNDPDACPPCRLLDIVPGGDYGFRFRYGRSGLHPLQAWNGELPGTLPMVCGVDEAPTALLWHNGRLWATSWGDHRIDAYTLTPRGASFGATREVVVQGDDDFRPTGMAVAPDGSLYFGDWIRRDYPVHGHGKIWHLTSAQDTAQSDSRVRARGGDRPPLDATKTIDVNNPLMALASVDPFAHATGVWAYSKRDGLEAIVAEPQNNPRIRLGLLEALRIKGTKDTTIVLGHALTDDSPDVRLFAVRWIADDHITALRDQVANLLDVPPSNSRYYLAVLAAVDWLDHDPRQLAGRIADGLLVRELENKARPPAVKAIALGLISPDDPYLNIERLKQYLASESMPLRMAAIRTLGQQTNTNRFALLAEVAKDQQETEAIRAEAVSGLAADAQNQRELLTQLASPSAARIVQREAARALRLAHLVVSPQEDKPPASDLAAWNALLDKPGDAAAGRRLFFSAVGPRCSACHEFNGRGGRVGPDLSLVNRTTSRAKTVESILQPSKEIAPEFQSWVLTTTDGKTLSGLRLPKAGDDGVEDYADPTGKKFSLRSEEIESRTAATTSIMPDGFERAISIDDLRDLVTFLSSPADADLQ